MSVVVGGDGGEGPAATDAPVERRYVHSLGLAFDRVAFDTAPISERSLP